MNVKIESSLKKQEERRCWIPKRRSKAHSDHLLHLVFKEKCVVSYPLLNRIIGHIFTFLNPEMMRLFLPCLRFSLLFLLATVIHASAQVVISTKSSPSPPNTDAVLFLEGNGRQGLIIPVVNDVASSTVTPAQGMVVFCTCSGQNNVQYFNGTSWTIVGGGGGGVSGIRIQGNVVTIDNSGTASFSLSQVAPSVNGQLLMWDTSLNSGSGGWSGSRSIAPSAVGQVLKWNGTSWEPGTDNTGTATTGNFTSPNSSVKITNGTNAVIGSGTTIDIQNATAGQTGLLAQTDFNTFNNKVGSVTATAPLVSSGGVTPQISFTGWPINAAGSLTNDGAGILTWAPASTSFTNANVIPKGSAGGLVASGIFEDAAGNLGIGTTTPGYTLDVNGNALIKPGILGSAPYLGTSWFSMQHQTLPLNNKSYGFAQHKSGYTLINAPANAGANFIDFRIDDNGIMRILENGNVGLGFPNPVNKLDVADGMAIGNSFGGTFVAPANGLIVEGDVGIGTSTPSHRLTLFNPAAFSLVNFQTNATGTSSIDGFMVGLNQPNGESILYNWENQDMIFGTNATERMRIDAGGNVGIGITSPLTKLHVNHPNITGEGLTIQNSGGNKWTLGVNNALGYLEFYGGSLFLARINAGSGTYTVVSDKRLKKNIGDIESVLAKVTAMQIRRYHFKTQNDNEASKIGVIAQELKEVFPELVEHEPSKDLFTVDYAGMGPIAIKAIQEQQKIIETLQTEMNHLKKELARINNYLGMETKATKKKTRNK
jgi:hypothetical protein